MGIADGFDNLGCSPAGLPLAGWWSGAADKTAGQHWATQKLPCKAKPQSHPGHQIAAPNITPTPCVAAWQSGPGTRPSPRQCR